MRVFRFLLAVIVVVAAAPAAATAQEGPHVAVSRFEDKTAKGWRDIGEGMADMLATGLANTGRLVVLERQALSDVLGEQDLASSGRIKEGTGAPTGEILGARYLVTGAVTAFEPDYRGGGGGLGLPRVGFGIGGEVKQAYVAVDLRLVDTSTSRILFAVTVEGTSTDVAAGLGGVVGGGKSTLPFALGGWSKTPMEKAVRSCIDKAVQQIAGSIP